MGCVLFVRSMLLVGCCLLCVVRFCCWLLFEVCCLCLIVVVRYVCLRFVCWLVSCFIYCCVLCVVCLSFVVRGLLFVVCGGLLFVAPCL